MPLMKCQSSGKSGWKWGKSGKCYVGPQGRSKAIAQARAIKASQGKNSTKASQSKNRKKKVVYNQRNPLKQDPSRTTTLRKQFGREFRRRFRRIQKAIIDLIIKEDAFGLKKKSFNTQSMRNLQVSFPDTPLSQQERDVRIENVRWADLTNLEKVNRFTRWLRNLLGNELLSEEELEKYWETFLAKAYEKGHARAFDEVNKGISFEISFSEKEGEKVPKKIQDIAEERLEGIGVRKRFIDLALGAPETREKIELLTTGAFNSIQGVSEGMLPEIVKELVDGLAQGDNPRDIARRMTDRLGVGRRRAERIARTEIIRAHAEGAIDSMERLGVQEISVAVEWSTAGDSRVCPKCRPLEGIVMPIKKAHGMFPRHDNCVAGDMRVSAPGLTHVLKGLYSGEIFDFTIAQGRRISITSHHIVLTQRGWVFAKDIKYGDYLVDSRMEGIPQNPDDYLGEPLIRNVFGSFVNISDPSRIIESLPMSKDLHGDGKSFNSEISIVDADGILRDQFVGESMVSEFSKELSLSNGYPVRVDSLFLDSNRSFFKTLQRLGRTSDSLMSSLGITDILLARSSRHHQPVSIGIASDSDSFSYQESPDGFPSMGEVSGELSNASSLKIEFDNLVSNRLRRIELIEVRHVNSFPVYDMSTETSLYTVEGLITSNCRCSPIPANVGEDTSKQVRDKRGIEAAVGRSLKADKPSQSLEKNRRESRWRGANKVFPKAPKSLFEE